MGLPKVGVGLCVAALVTAGSGAAVTAEPDAAVDHGWSATADVTSASSSTRHVRTLDTAVNQSGAALIGWAEESDSVHVARLPSGAASNWSGTQLSSEGQRVRVAIGEQGHGAAMWQEWQLNRPRLLVAFMALDGTWSPPRLLSDSGRPFSSVDPLAVTSDGSVLAGWKSRTKRHVAHFSADGELLDTQTLSGTAGSSPVLMHGWQGAIDAWYRGSTPDGQATIEVRSWTADDGWSDPVLIDAVGPYRDRIYASDPLQDIRYAAWLEEDGRRLVVKRAGAGKSQRILSREITPQTWPCVESYPTSLSAAAGHLVVGWAVNQHCGGFTRYGILRGTSAGTWRKPHLEIANDHVGEPVMAAAATAQGGVTMTWVYSRALTTDQFGPTANRVRARDFRPRSGWGPSYLVGAGHLYTFPGWPRAPSFAMSPDGSSVIAWLADRDGDQDTGWETVLARRRAFTS